MHGLGRNELYGLGHWVELGAGRGGLGSLQMRVGAGRTGLPWARRVAAVRSRLPQKGKGNAAGPPPPFPRDLLQRRSSIQVRLL